MNEMNITDLITDRMHENLKPRDIDNFEQFRWLIEMIAIEYAQEQVKNLTIPIVSNSLPTIECERCNKLATHKANLLEENHKLRQRLIDAGLEQPAIRNDIRG